MTFDPIAAMNDQMLQRLDAERAHNYTLKLLASAWKTPITRLLLRRYAAEPDERLRQRIWNLPFANPLGVAAGLDKNGIALEPLLSLGFSFAEMGTVTLRPQDGNPRPRIWRASESEAVINALGFPNEGAAALRNRLVHLRPAGIVGVNIGKSKDTPPEEAPGEYAALTRAVLDVAQYIVINVSSPNTPGLRDLQAGEHLRDILTEVLETNHSTARIIRRESRPVLVKIAPDLTSEQIEELAGVAVDSGVDGIIATNTTSSRDGIPDRYRDLPGGLSGAPLRERATEVVRIAYRATSGAIPIVGVGGIGSGADAIERIRAGATLVQIYTAMIYAGPALAGNILHDISAAADRDGWNSIDELVGIDT